MQNNFGDSHRRTSLLPTLQVAAGAALISFSPVFAKVAHVGPATTAFYRLAIGGLLLTLVAVANRRDVRRPRRSFVLPAVCGLLVAIDLSVWHRSINLIGPGLATILGNHQVFVLAGFGILFLGERLSARLTIAIVVAMVGLFLIFGFEWDSYDYNSRLGVLFGILTALMYGAFLLVLRLAQSGPQALSPTDAVATLSIVAAIVLALYVWLGGESFHVPDASTWVVLVGYAIIAHVVGWVLISTGLPSIPASRAGLLLLLQPALAFVWDVVLFSRPTTTVELIGASMALFAIYLGANGGRGSRQMVDDTVGNSVNDECRMQNAE